MDLHNYYLFTVCTLLQKVVLTSQPPPLKVPPVLEPVSTFNKKFKTSTTYRVWCRIPRK